MKKRILGLIAFVVALAMVITILPVNTVTVQAASKKPKLSKKGISVDIDAKETLTIKNVKDDSVIKWKIANPDVAKVTSKGVIKGKKAGETTVSCTVKSAKKKYTLSAKVTVTDSISVSSQKKLESALNRDDTALITLKTPSKKSFTIPEGDYSGKTLVVDAKKSDVVNNGVFKAITIKAIAENTWTENAQGNVLTISAAAGHIVIPADANFSEIIVTSTNASSNFVLDIAGNIGKVTVESQTKLKLNVTGTVDAIAVNDRAQLDIKGSSEQNIPIEVFDTADGTLINSNIPVVVETQSDTEINLGKGAENSTITASNTEKAVEVTNNTASSISVTTGDVSQDVNSGKNATIDGEGKITNTTTPEKQEKPEDDTASSGGESAGGASGSVGGGGASGGGYSGGGSSGGGYSGGGYSGGGASGGGSSSGGYSGGESSGGGASGGGYSGGGYSGGGSSGNISRYIVRFQASSVIAGKEGNAKPTSELNLPSFVYGEANDGQIVKFAVSSWTNTDGYTQTSPSGFYTFTAVLGESEVAARVDSGVIATCEVQVTAESQITFSEYTPDDCKNIEVTNVWSTPKGFVFEIQNNNSIPIEITGRAYLYKEGVLQYESNSVFAYIVTGGKSCFGENYAYESPAYTFDTYHLELSVNKNENAGDASSISVTVGDKDGSGRYPITVKNIGAKYIKVAYLYVLGLSGTEIVDSQRRDSWNLGIGQSTEVTYYEYGITDGVIVYASYVTLEE